MGALDAAQLGFVLRFDRQTGSAVDVRIADKVGGLSLDPCLCFADQIERRRIEIQRPAFEPADADGLAATGATSRRRGGIAQSRPAIRNFFLCH